ncbi:hypothetical protein Tco_0525169 [Tanacetum coccineum]
MHISKDAGVSLVLRIDNTLPLVENADSEATEETCALVEPTPVAVEADADSLAIEGNLIDVAEPSSHKEEAQPLAALRSQLIPPHRDLLDRRCLMKPRHRLRPGEGGNRLPWLFLFEQPSS